MGDVAYLGMCDGDGLRELADEVDAKDVTHLVVCYRTSDGLAYRLIGHRDLTYLIGMMGRVQTHLHCADSFVTTEPEP
jgi:hypothetical protein